MTDWIAVSRTDEPRVYNPSVTLQSVLPRCGIVTPYGDKNLGNISSGNVLLFDGTKPLAEPVLNTNQ